MGVGGADVWHMACGKKVVVKGVGVLLVYLGLLFVLLLGRACVSQAGGGSPQGWRQQWRQHSLPLHICIGVDT